ncbi:sugar ABC transporter substrate-binding protein [Christensenella intestinihominis]|uniref:sugar ABC transporter substrate-binding protein n=1 Tax=Christensenella intestinihominis TaxID=1851429 RepID=UPI000837473E|nr:sugar ABC transporter substrate-binding protein [Christensenella intestinihominis]
MKKILLTILAVVLVVALGATMVGCSAPAAEPSESASTEASTAPESSAPAEESASADAGAKDSYTFGYIAYNTADIWNDYSQKAFEYAASQADVDVEVVALDSKNSVEESVKAMESLIQQEVDGISIFPISIEQGAQLVKMANDAGIPVTIENFEMDTPDPGDYIAAVACKYDDIGYAAINYIAEQKPGAKIFFCAGQEGAGVYEKYQEGVDKAMAELGDKVEIVGTEHGDWETEKAMNVTQNFIQSGAEFDYIFANNGLMAKGCYQALKEAGMEDIPIVSTGGSPDDYQMLVDKVEAANMTAPVSIQGIQTFKNLYDTVVLGQAPTDTFQPLPVIAVSADDLGKFIAWDDYEAAYNYVYGGAEIAK